MEDVILNGESKIYKGAIIGEGSVITAPVIIGMPPRGKKEGELEVIIGNNAVIRPFTVIYAGCKIGNNFQTGQGVTIREDNIIGDDVSIGTNTVLEVGNQIGNNTRIHTGCFLELTTIEEDVFIGPNVVFTDDPHPPCPKYKECLKGAIVKRLAKIGANSTILPGITIGINSLVGAGSVVVDDVLDNKVVAGNPARVINDIDNLKCFKRFYMRPYLWPPYKL
ncbi:TPA: transferase [bacterium]|nr:transferase [bacterium]